VGKNEPRDAEIRVAHRITTEWHDIPHSSAEGLWHDLWFGRTGSLTIEPPAWATKLRIVGNKLPVPDHLQLLATANGVTARREVLAVGHFIVDIPFRAGQAPVTVNFVADRDFRPSTENINGDDHRDLSWILVAVQAAK
jgi:hypothetical protein